MFIKSGKNNSKKVNLAIGIANSDVFKQALIKKLRTVPSYDMTDAKPDYIHRKLFATLNNTQVNVVVYYPRNRWSKALAYFTSSKPNDININGYKLNRSVNSIVGTLYHEVIHLVDNLDMIYSFGHADNSATNKGGTAPYKIGSLAKEVSELINNNPEPARTYVSFYKRFLRWLF